MVCPLISIRDFGTHGSVDAVEWQAMPSLFIYTPFQPVEIF